MGIARTALRVSGRPAYKSPRPRRHRCRARGTGVRRPERALRGFARPVPWKLSRVVSLSQRNRYSRHDYGAGATKFKKDEASAFVTLDFDGAPRINCIRNQTIQPEDEHESPSNDQVRRA